MIGWNEICEGRFVTMRQCSRCREHKSPDDFYKRAKSGLQYYCKACSLAIAKTPEAYARVVARNKVRYRTDEAFHQACNEANRRRRQIDATGHYARQRERRKDPVEGPLIRQYCRELYARQTQDPEYVERRRRYYRNWAAKRKKKPP